jgi:hypothetical protein
MEISMSLKFALEDNEPEVVEEPSEEVPAEVEAGAADVEAGSTEVEDGLGEIETAGEDTAAIGEIADVVERSVTPDENGEGGEGLSPEAAEIAEIAVERLRERIGLKKSTTGKLSLEAFGSASNRVTASNMALEGFKEYVSKAWEAIKKAWNFVIGKIIELWKRIFDANTKVAAAAKSLGAAADKAKGKSASEVAFDNANIAGAFAGSSSEAKAADVESVLKTHGEQIDKALAFAVEVESTLKGFEGVLDKVKAQKKDDQAQIIDNKGIQEELTKLVEKLAANGKSAFKSGTAVGLIDNGSFEVDFTAGEGTTAGYIKASFKSNPSKATKVKTLTPEEAASVAKAVEELSKKVGQLQAKKSLLSGAQKAIDSLISKAVSEAGSLEGNEGGAKELKATMEAAKQYTSQIGQVYGQVATVLPKLSIRAEKLALDYVSASLGKYKSKD